VDRLGGDALPEAAATSRSRPGFGLHRVIVMSASAIDLTGLYVSEQGRLRRFINRLVGNRATAEDLVQDAFLNLLRGVHATEIEHSRSYLTRTAKNLAIDHLRREKTQAQYKAELGPADAQACSRPQPDAIVQGRQELAVLRRVIGQLPVKCRIVFLLSREHGLTMRQIAAKLGIAEKTVEKHLMRAMVDCRRELRAVGRDV
jgi:RNA polymerase sigma factor (sigma-70 family)